jgi:hypothetical protein
MQTQHHQRNNLKEAIKSSQPRKPRADLACRCQHIRRISFCLSDPSGSHTGLKTTVPHSLCDNSLPMFYFAFRPSHSSLLLLVSPLSPSTRVSLLPSAHAPAATCTLYQQFILPCQLSHLLAKLKFSHRLCEFKQGNN